MWRALSAAASGGGTAPPPPPPPPPEQQQQQQAPRASATATTSLSHDVNRISAAMTTLSALLDEQADKVDFVADAAEAARDDMRSGNRELAQAAARPGNLLRDAAVVLFLAMAAGLLFLDWQFR